MQVAHEQAPRLFRTDVAVRDSYAAEQIGKSRKMARADRVETIESVNELAQRGMLGRRYRLESEPGKD